MRLLNKVTLIGRLGKDPELRKTSANASVCNFSLATNDVWIDKEGNKKERAEWHRIAAYGKLGEWCKISLAQSYLVYIEGKMRTNSWVENDQTRYSIDIEASSVILLDDRKDHTG